MNLPTAPYSAQHAGWPQSGRHIMAQYDATTIIVYQAYCSEIGHCAATHNHFGGPAFSLSRMSWIKPNFLWMMYRSGWSTKPGQEVTLAIRLRREAFDEVLSQAVHSRPEPDIYPSKADWQSRVKSSDVRLQWDPDHNPSGAPIARRAIQLGLRGEMLAKYAREWIVSIEDITDFVRQQAVNARHQPYSDLLVPIEMPYPVTDNRVAKKLQVASSAPERNLPCSSTSTPPATTSRSPASPTPSRT